MPFVVINSVKLNEGNQVADVADSTVAISTYMKAMTAVVTPVKFTQHIKK